MAEVGLVRYARVALEVAQRVLPAYRTKFSKHKFSQPQLLAILCLMRYEEWTFRETQVRLAEHSELRQALQLESTPDYTTLYRVMRRLEEGHIRKAMAETVRQACASESAASVAVDATGLASGALSTFFVRRCQEHGGQPRQWKRWLKWLIAIDIDRQIILEQQARWGPYNDGATLAALIDKVQGLRPVKLVLADAEFDSERNHQPIRGLGAMSIIPAKRGKAEWRRNGIRAQMQHDFPSHLYAKRSLVEMVFSSVKRKLSDRAPGKSFVTQSMQALLLGLSYNLYRLKLCLAMDSLTR